MLHESIALSIILGFLSSEFLGVSAGGLVSPGYLAFFLEQPLRIVSTLALALCTYAVVRLLQRWLILYGRRRFMAAVLISIIGAWWVEKLFFYTNMIPQDMRIIGYVIPGLIANDMTKQGPFKTIAMTMVITVLVRCLLLLRFL